MKRKNSFIRLLLVNMVVLSLGVGAVAVKAEPEDEPEEPYSQESYYYEEPYSYEEPDEPVYSEEPEYSYEESYEYSYEYSYEESGEPEGSDYTESSGEPYEYSEDSYTETSDEESSFYGYSEGDESSELYPQESSDIQESWGSYYEVSDQSSYTETSPEEISGYEYSDNSTLTSEDWEKLRQSNVSRFDVSIGAYSGGDEAIRKIKQDEQSTANDDWVFLLWGIVLISAGVIAILVVIFTSIYSKKKLAAKPVNSPPVNNKPQAGPEDETGSVDISSDSGKRKDDYDDYFDGN